LFSQEDPSVESLIASFEDAKERSEKFDYALSIALTYSLKLENDKANEYLNIASKLTDTTNSEEKALILYTKGRILTADEQFESAEQKHLESLELSRKLNDKELIINNYSGLASIYGYQSKIYLSNSYWFSCIPYYQKENDPLSLQNAYNNIGFNYTQYDEHEQAIPYFLESYDIAYEFEDIDGMSAALINSGYAYEMLGKNDSALIQYRASIPLHQELGIEEYVGYSYVLMGTIYAKLNQTDSAVFYLEKSRLILEQKEDDYGMSYVHYGYALYYEHIGDNKKSEYHAVEGVKYSKNSFFINNEMKSLNVLQRVLYNQGKYKGAYDNYAQFVHLRDSIKNPLNSREIAGLEYKYEYQTKHLSDSLKFEEDKRLASFQHEEEIKRYWLYALTGSVVLIFLVILIIIQIRNSKIRKKKNQELREKNDEINRQKEQVEVAHFELEVKNQEILDSITYAKRIQSAILPPAKIVKEYLHQSFILYKPKDIVAGDFYWLEHKDDKVLFAAADCTGHGVPGAMVSVICNNGLNRSVREHNLTDPAAILNKTREIVIAEFEKSEEEVKDGMDIALCSLDGNRLKFAGAHNPLWIIRNGSNEIEEIKADKQPIGKFATEKPFTTHKILLNKGDAFYIFSDGFADQFGGDKGKKFKAVNFKKLLLSIRNKPLENQKKLLEDAFEAWKGSLEQLDDICVIGVKI
jgi:serine phosphatase RsbU (regulator of sigma subunit)